jgi:C1A family cysteine protease
VKKINPLLNSKKVKKEILILLLLASANLFAQDSLMVRTLGANPTDLITLSKMTIATPLFGATGIIPSSFRMDDECPPVNNQCYIGSCISEATAYSLCGILAKRQNNWDYYYDNNRPNLDHLFSPLYMHYYIKGCDNDCGRCGSNLGSASNFLINKGVPTLSQWNPNHCDRNACNFQPNFPPNPNNPSAFRLNSVKPIFLTGIQYASGYKTNSIKYFVSQNNPIPIAMALDQSFLDGSAFDNPKDIWQYFKGQSVGGHAMLIVGYDDSREAFLVMNSWGTTNWNLKKNDPTNDARSGFCWISYDIIENYCYEAFVANVPQTGYSVSVQDLLNVSKSVNTEESVSEINEMKFFITNRYNQNNNIRLIPININKAKDESTIAIYKVSEGQPRFYSTFTIKLKEIYRFQIDGRKYTFKALYIKPWRKYLEIFKSKDALFYQMTVE